MAENAFDLVEERVKSGDGLAATDLVVEQCREQANYPLLFEAMLLRKRFELGLPLVQTGPLGDLPDAQRRAYEDAYIEAARIVGGLYLAAGDIPRAWPYFRAIGEPAPVSAAIERVEPGEGLEAVIEIAFHERVHPRKGFELILASFGTCSAITNFEQYPAREGRDDCVRLLVRKLHGDLVESLRHAITRQEGQQPDSRSITVLVAGRDWLFEENNYHIDTSHLAAVVRYSLDATDRDTLALALELTEYGRRLSPMFQFRGTPPFDDIYLDHAAYLRALLGDDPDGGVLHFRSKLEKADPEQVGTGPAQILVTLLARLGRYSEAIQVSADHLRNVEDGQLVCPSAAQLCHMAGEHRRLMALSRERGDLLTFAAAALEASAPQ